MAASTIITVICCVCKKLIEKKDGGGVSGTSHGYCPECKEAEWQKFLETTRRDNG